MKKFKGTLAFIKYSFNRTFFITKKFFIFPDKYVFLGKIPLMTEKGTFIINGNTRVIVVTETISLSINKFNIKYKIIR